MIGIRSITYQIAEAFGSEEAKKVQNASFQWQHAYPLIRTQRISLSPMAECRNIRDLNQIAAFCNDTDIRWFDVPIAPRKSSNMVKLFHFAHQILTEYKSAFVNVLAVENGKIRDDIMKEAANLIRGTANISPNGNDNFRLGVSMNVRPNGPFFPFTYAGNQEGFSIALELTQEINKLCIDNRQANIVQLRQLIIDTIVPQVDEIEKKAKAIGEKNDLYFFGFDFSLAPIIEENGSVFTILNALGIYDFGQIGSMFATGFLTNILKYFAKRYKSVGFSGVMYSLLEDMELCTINNERGISLNQLISLSTMCGCGVDMVPVYEKITNEEICVIMMEVAGISCRLNKPLGVRLLPIPKAKRGVVTYTKFYDDADFISNTKVVLPQLNLLTRIGQELTYLEN